MPDLFPDNWTYLRTELNWLDRVLAGAIARQRQEAKEVERVSKARIDQITSHWWKGIIQVEGTAAGDSPADLPRRQQTKVSYQQQMEARIQASQQQGIVLGLPALCQKLGLSAFEKNVVLFALAPEISRRYGRIYNFLQETDHPGASGLPTIDLLLRLLCRNDSEWRAARLAFSQQAKLLQQEIIVLPVAQRESLLAHPVKLSAAIAEFLLAESPHLASLDPLLTPSLALVPIPPAPVVALPATWSPEQVSPPRFEAAIATLPPASADLWSTLVLPDPLRADLQHLSDRWLSGSLINEAWTMTEHSAPVGTSGTIAFLLGAPGTGKTLAARAIAQSLQLPLTIVDLAFVEPADALPLLHHLTTVAPPLLLLKSVANWFGRSPQVSPVALRQWLQSRQQFPTLTLLSGEQANTVMAVWYPWLTVTLKLPKPNRHQRLQLWQQAFPPLIPLDKDMDWAQLAAIAITGGMIQAIAREAAIYATTDPTAAPGGTVEMRHIRQAGQFLGIKC